MLGGASEANSIRSAVVWLTSCGLSKVRFVKGELGLAKMPSFLQKLDDTPSAGSSEQEAVGKNTRAEIRNAGSHFEITALQKLFLAVQK